MSNRAKCVVVVCAWLGLCAVLGIQSGPNPFLHFFLYAAAATGSICSVIGGTFGHPIAGLLGGVVVLFCVVSFAAIQ